MAYPSTRAKKDEPVVMIDEHQFSVIRSLSGFSAVSLYIAPESKLAKRQILFCYSTDHHN